MPFDVKFRKTKRRKTENYGDENNFSNNKIELLNLNLNLTEITWECLNISRNGFKRKKLKKRKVWNYEYILFFKKNRQTKSFWDWNDWFVDLMIYSIDSSFWIFEFFNFFYFIILSSNQQTQTQFLFLHPMWSLFPPSTTSQS